jgi:DNA-binding transcriptional ArsR family regulator
MDFARSLAVVTPTLDGDVLAALSRAEEEFSGRELARHIGRGSPEGIRGAADRLVAQGVVTRRAAGTAHLYRLNRDHIASTWIEGLANLRGQLIDRLRDLLADWEQPPRVALLFGSVASGQATAASDLDILLVRRADCDPDSEPWQAQLIALGQRTTAWTGNDTRVLEYGEDELVGEVVIENALRNGLELFGSRRSLRQLIHAGAER